MSDDRLLQRFGAATAEHVAALDAAAVSLGVDVLQLMEVAGWQVARCAWRMLHRRPGRVLAVTGRGNNGGDALVAARLLDGWGCEVRCVVVGDPATLRQVPARQRDAAVACGVAVDAAADAEAIRRLATDAAAADLVLDGVLGTGLRSDPRSPDADVITALPGTRVLAIDVPSGLDASSGTALQPCVRAAATCTLAVVKAGLWTESGRSHAGTLYAAAIGMPRAAFDAAGLPPPAALRGGALLRVPG